MKFLKSLGLRAVALIGVGCLASSSSFAVALTSTEGIFNFDLTSLSPAPPYTNVTFGAIFSAADPVTSGTDTVFTYLYGGLDGTQLLQVRNDTAPGFAYNTAFSNNGTQYGPLETANPIFDPMLDGVFSIGLQVMAGSADLLSVTACGVTQRGIGPCVTDAPPSNVPEPATAGLLSLGVAALGFARRKRKK
jgi:PEP-CTERM motif